MNDQESSIGLIEIGSWTASLAAIDAAEKSAHIRVLQVELNDLLGTSIKIAGPTADVHTALAAARAAAAALNASVVVAPINRPHPQSSRLWPAQEEFNPLIEQNVVHVPRPIAAMTQNIQDQEQTMPDQQQPQRDAPYAIGFIETQGFTAVIEAIDAACKAASVDVVGKEKLGGGYISVVIRGDVAAVKAAIEAGRAHVEGLGKLIAAHVIPRPSQAVLSLLPRS
ncbi:BMC domain-containing protein [Fontivita pretiosa]|uniref:BMC domain-containing protein n=1 Tax=Fontivita pretiosa TaxID=2989684 RepID=UPI003D17283D